ncbi:MAG: hypothetical protein JST28_13155 [Acidobacteria bacterium]|nr:hypothetical protein [Acidobacteriota bacterium]
MRSRSLALLAFILAVIFLPMHTVNACGPWFEPDIFVRTGAPDDLQAFAKGQLGILQAGFDSNEYAVAYRYLNAGKLSEEELKFYAPADRTRVAESGRILSPDEVYEAQQAEIKAHQAAQPPKLWLAERVRYVPQAASADQKSSFPTDYEGNIVFDENYLNCPDAAFENAYVTLKKRAETWGKQSPWLVDWIRAQDTVFSNCAGKSSAVPSSASAEAPALLKTDRAYQIASAALYGKKFDEAIRQFDLISQDQTSHWQSWGIYLAARATVRKAFAMGSPTDPYGGELASYDKPTMIAAQNMLQGLLNAHNPPPSRSIIEHELNFIRIRTEPEERVQEICAALAGPAPDPDFSNDIKDLNWLLTKRLQIKSPPPLLAWIHAWRGGTDAATAFTSWQQGHALPWLMIALSKAGPSDAFTPSLIDEAARIAPGTPAYDTAFYHRARLLIALKRTDEARVLLDAALPPLQRQKPSSTLNALLGERMQVARDLDEFLRFAPRTVLATGSSPAETLQSLCNARFKPPKLGADCPALRQPLELGEDGAAVVNRQLSIGALIKAAQSTILPANLREQIAIVAWTRAVLLQDSGRAAQIAPALPKAMRDDAGTGVGFRASLFILRNPGIRPYLEPGIPRVASFSQFDDFRDNWWCKPWNKPHNPEDSMESAQQKADKQPTPAFLAPSAAALAKTEYQHLQELPDSIALIGRRVVDYAKDHQNDPQVPEALALTVRAGHYACESWDSNRSADAKSVYTPVSKAAFELLHKRYPKSPWALKTRYYY